MGCLEITISRLSCIVKIGFMIEIYSRDDKGIGVAYKITSPKNQSQISQMEMGQYWLSKQMQNAFKKVLQSA